MSNYKRGQFMRDMAEGNFHRILEWIQNNKGTRQQCAEAVGVSRTTVMIHLPRVRKELENNKEETF